MFWYYLKSVKYLFYRWVIHKKYLVAYTPKFKLYFKFKTEDVQGRLIYKRGIYEEELTHFLLHNLKLEAHDIIFDIGANLGWYSLLLNKISPKSQIYAFEPDPVNFTILEQNIKLNNAKEIRAQQLALSDSSESKTLYLYPSKNSGRHSLLPINSGQQMQVLTVALDEFVDNSKLDYSKIKFIKIDIEGYEYFAFMGAKKVLEFVPYILSEYSPNYMKKGKINPEDLLHLLYSYSFVPHSLEKQKLIELTKEEILSKGHNINIFWKKEGSSL